MRSEKAGKKNGRRRVRMQRKKQGEYREEPRALEKCKCNCKCK